jgi:hypothetical protein
VASEKLFENRLKRWLHTVGIYAAGTPSDRMTAAQCGWFLKVWGGGMQKSGIPDLLLCVNGLFLAVELKGDTGTLSELQRMNTARINQSNGIGIILYPNGFEDFKKIIQGVIDCNGHTVALNALKCACSSTKCVMLTEY